jgi:hypothetical protein
MLLTGSSLIDPDTARNLIALSAVLVSLMAVALPLLVLFRNRGDIKAVRSQVENNHRDADGNPINMREEADERHSENKTRLDNMGKSVLGIQDDLRGIRTELSGVWKVVREQGDDLHDLEKTVPKVGTPRRRTK